MSMSPGKAAKKPSDKTLAGMAKGAMAAKGPLAMKSASGTAKGEAQTPGPLAAMGCGGGCAEAETSCAQTSKKAAAPAKDAHGHAKDQAELDKAPGARH